MVGASQNLVSEPSSLVSRIAGAFRAPGASFLSEKAIGLTERRLIAYAFGAALFLTLARVMAETIRPELAIGADRIPWFAATVLSGFSFGVLGLYAVAALIRVVCRVFGGEGGWAETRLALFWSGLAAGPLIVIGHCIGAALDGRSLAGLIGGAIWAALFAPMLAKAHGFPPLRIAIFLAISFIIVLSLPVLG